MTSRKFFLVVVALLAAFGSCSPVNECSTEVLQSKLTELQKKFDGHIPLNVYQLRKTCKLIPEWESDLFNIVKPCIPTFVQSLLKDVLKKVTDNVLSHLCDLGELQDLYLKSADCLHRNSPSMLACGEQLQEELLPTVVNFSIPNMCCPMAQAQFCAQNAAQSSCGQDAVEFFNRTFGLLESVNLYQFACRDQDCSAWFTTLPPTTTHVTHYTTAVEPTSSLTTTEAPPTPPPHDRSSEEVDVDVDVAVHVHFHESKKD